MSKDKLFLYIIIITCLETRNFMKIQLDMYQTLAAAVLVLLLGNYLRKKNKLFGKILYSGTCYRRIAICYLYLYMLYHGNY